MVTINPKNKELTVKQYEFYKRKGLNDEKVMELHGYNTVSLNAWKKKHNLIGVKFEPEVKVSAITTFQKEEAKPLREKEVAPEPDRPEAKKVENASASLSVDSKARISQAEVMNRHTSDNSALEARTIDVSDMDDNSLDELLESLTTPLMDVLEEPTSTYIQQLEEQHCKDTETIARLESDNECLQKRLKGAVARQDENRSETLHEQNKRREEAEESDNRYNALVLETNRRIEKLERAHEIEVRNLQNDIAVQNKALEKHAEDEQLIGMLLRKAGGYAERVVSE